MLTTDGGVLLDKRYRTERCRDLVEECRRRAASTLSDQMKSRYLHVAKDYTLLAPISGAASLFRTERTRLSGAAQQSAG
jgi:hypothetical protein